MDGDEDGDGGPKVVGDTKVWGEGVIGVGGTIAGVIEPDVEVAMRAGEVGGVGRFCTSRENRFPVPTDKPWSCSARTRSAIDPPALYDGPSLCAASLQATSQHPSNQGRKSTYAACFSIVFSFSSMDFVLWVRSLQSPLDLE